MRNAIAAAILSSPLVCASAGTAAAFVCPVKTVGASSAQDQAIAAVVATGDGLADPAKLNAAVDTLRGKGIGNAIVVDALIAAYCPTVAGNAALSEAHRRAQVQRFAARVTRLVYALESVDAVILDVPFRPDVIDAINARAAAERVSPEAWVAGAVDRALKAQR